MYRTHTHERRVEDACKAGRGRASELKSPIAGGIVDEQRESVVVAVNNRGIRVVKQGKLISNKFVMQPASELDMELAGAASWLSITELVPLLWRPSLNESSDHTSMPTTRRQTQDCGRSSHRASEHKLQVNFKRACEQVASSGFSAFGGVQDVWITTASLYLPIPFVKISFSLYNVS
ncbi:hypothetical protein BDN70DRAFT_898993 [Pholiota conissans]|uniref:Uncharacterized protein n=1 Tax=Pholiota conissans TaxID=109636 RepID=A0A9P6CVP6_9AGAR|nr:hypothetical protein BDN70DRAFT_898993 [Pholiota conissans]